MFNKWLQHFQPTPQNPEIIFPPLKDSTQALLQVENLRIAYQQRIILDNVNFSVGMGEFWFLLGRNGVGKTSFLNGLLGLLSPEQGTYRLHPELQSRIRLGFVPQHCSFNPSLATSVREFVSLGLVGFKLSSAERAMVLTNALQRLNLTALATRNYWSLSGGQQQRVRLARALIRRPYFLLLDEPTNGLDIATQAQLFEDLSRLQHAEGLSILLVSHDMQLAARYATHIALFHAGTVQVVSAQCAFSDTWLQQHLYGTGEQILNVG